MPVKFTFKADFSDVARALTDFRKSQIPFATTLALTWLAKGVAEVEGKETVDVFESPTPFTQNSFTIVPATRADPVAYVFPKRLSEPYLRPYVFGGLRYLGEKKGMLDPIGAPTNQYGNLPRNALARLKGKPNVFIGPVKAKDGRIINGVWQRSGPMTAPTVGRRKGAAPVEPARHLKLLIKFEDTTEAPKHFPFFESAKAYLRANTKVTFRKALAHAMKTANKKKAKK